LWGGAVPRGETEKQESSFSEEKEAKRLLFLRQRNDPGHGPDRRACLGLKVFCFLSSEKKIFLSLRAVLLQMRGASE
jgi:hypothetical protein